MSKLLKPIFRFTLTLMTIKLGPVKLNINRKSKISGSKIQIDSNRFGLGFESEHELNTHLARF